MKKVILGLLALSAVSLAQGDMYLNARFGGDIGAKYDSVSYVGATILTDKTDGFGGELALEGYKSLTDSFDLGLGLAYQFHADRKKNDVFVNNADFDGKYSGVEYKSLPIYLTGKYNFNLDSEIRPYLKVNLGYSFNFDSSDLKMKALDGSGTFKYSTDVEDGLYWAVGGGLEYYNFTIDLMYAITEAKSEAKSKDENFDIEEDSNYGRVVLSAGYRFNL